MSLDVYDPECPIMLSFSLHPAFALPSPCPNYLAFLSVVMYNHVLRWFLMNIITLQPSRSHLLNPPMTRNDLSGIHALVFDVIGTTTDWHSPVQQALEVVAAKRPDLPPRDWSKFAHEWRQG